MEEDEESRKDVRTEEERIGRSNFLVNEVMNMLRTSHHARMKKIRR